jgi:ribosomal protein S18 acetylase RimI-like enzyme
VQPAFGKPFPRAFDDAETYVGAPPDESYCQEVLSRDHVVVLAALEEAAVVGGLVAYELYKLERARSEVYIYDLAVARSHRRQGIARRLIEQLRTIAHERGAWVADRLRWVDSKRQGSAINGHSFLRLAGVVRVSALRFLVDGPLGAG